MIVFPLVIMFFIGLIPLNVSGNGVSQLGTVNATNPYHGAGPNGVKSDPQCSFWAIIPKPTLNCYEESAGGGNSMSLSLGVVAIVAIIVALALTGVQVFGSGLSDATVLTILTVVPLSALFTLFSIQALPLLVSIPYVGLPLESGLIGMYSIGVLRSVVIG